MHDEFYVGYLALPKGYKHFLISAVAMLILLAVVVSLLITSQQNDPGNGRWDLSHSVTLTGVLHREPYAMVMVPDGADGSERHVLLVTMGKIGGQGLNLPSDGEPVTVSGYPVSRSANPVLLAIESHGVTPSRSTETGLKTWTPSPIGTLTLEGQIIDPKCYFGAMKPGEGKVHKACATLCISGGIPPMFMVNESDGSRTYYLLLDQEGNGITGDRLETLLPFVADPVRIVGVAERIGELLIMRIDPHAISRLQ